MSNAPSETADLFGEPQSSLFSAADMLGYRAGSVYDELLVGSGHFRAHWQPLMSRLAPLDLAQMTERANEASRLLRQNGVTYTIYDDPQGAERLWPLDLIPLVIPADEWQTIEAGVVQRARLLNAILRDIYGSQRMVDSGRIPPVLLEADPSFLRACHGIRPPGGTYLHLYAIDLARAPDGRWWVLADRTEAPSGAGYTLENRGVVGRVLGDCLTETPVRPLAPFFSELRDGLTNLAPAQCRAEGRPPRIVLLTPGAYNETYFEHVFLARHLGITLVEGADLTVRDRAVFLKTVGALEPVDVILRRLDDSFCDPLELRPDSTLGVAGLIEATRAGTVTVANALGSGVLQAMAFKPFLPALCQELLGEVLTLPDVASWWCGGEAELDYVVENLERLVIKPAFPALGFEPIFGAELNGKERKALAERIRARPFDFVGQERVALSCAPTWSDRRLQPRPLVLRVFVAAGPERFVAMPGGLTRVSSAAGRPIVSMQRGGGSKDTWVLGDAPAYLGVIDTDRTNVVPLSDLANRRLATSELPSRVANGLFWVGRYAERIDGLVRLLRTMLLGLTDATRPWAVRDVEPLLNLAAWLQLMPPQDFEHVQVGELVPLVRDALIDPTDANGVHANLGRLLRAAGNLRDRLPPDCWRAATSLARESPMNAAKATPVHLLLRLDELVTLGAALWGAVEDTMPRDTGWRFLEMGKRIERAMHLLAIVRGTPASEPVEARPARLADEQRLLTIIVALTGARLSARGRPDWTQHRATVLDAVLKARNDPRSLSFQLSVLDEHLTALPPPSAGSQLGQGAIGRTRNLVRTARTIIGECIVAACAPSAPRHGVAEDGDPMIAAFAPIDALLPDISNLISQAYFIHAFARPA